MKEPTLKQYKDSLVPHNIGHIRIDENVGWVSCAFLEEIHELAASFEKVETIRTKNIRSMIEAIKEYDQLINRMGNK